jgi:hypothetical protein
LEKFVAVGRALYEEGKNRIMFCYFSGSHKHYGRKKALLQPQLTPSVLVLRHMFNPAIEPDLIDCKAVGALCERDSIKSRVPLLIFRRLLKIRIFLRILYAKIGKTGNGDNSQRY